MCFLQRGSLVDASLCVQECVVWDLVVTQCQGACHALSNVQQHALCGSGIQLGQSSSGYSLMMHRLWIANTKWQTHITQCLLCELHAACASEAAGREWSLEEKGKKSPDHESDVKLTGMLRKLSDVCIFLIASD